MKSVQAILSFEMRVKLALTSIPNRQLELPQPTTTNCIFLPTGFCIHFFLYIYACIICAPIWNQTFHLKHQIPLYCSKKFSNYFLTHQFTESLSSAYNYATIFSILGKPFSCFHSLPWILSLFLFAENYFMCRLHLMSPILLLFFLKNTPVRFSPSLFHKNCPCQGHKWQNQQWQQLLKTNHQFSVFILLDLSASFDTILHLIVRTLMFIPYFIVAPSHSPLTVLSYQFNLLGL